MDHCHCTAAWLYNGWAWCWKFKIITSLYTLEIGVVEAKGAIVVDGRLDESSCIAAPVTSNFFRIASRLGRSDATQQGYSYYSTAANYSWGFSIKTVLGGKVFRNRKCAEILFLGNWLHLPCPWSAECSAFCRGVQDNSFWETNATYRCSTIPIKTMIGTHSGKCIHLLSVVAGIEYAIPFSLLRYDKPKSNSDLAVWGLFFKACPQGLGANRFFRSAAGLFAALLL